MGTSLAGIQPRRNISLSALELAKFCHAAPARLRLPLHAVAVATAIALAPALALAADSNAGGRSGNQAGCASVTDGHGATVSGSSAGESVGSRYRRECAPTVRTQPAPRRGPAPSAQPAPKKMPVRGAIVSGSVRPAEPADQPSAALRGDLVRASATVVTGGVVIWLIHSSLWTSLLVLGVPIWRHVDLLPVVDGRRSPDATPEGGARDLDEESAVAHLLDSGRRTEPPNLTAST
jgi:hypothetical protein